MATATDASGSAGSVSALYRYPVKSMQGEALDACAVTESGLLGDRACALIDLSDGKVASAKNPRKWPSLFQYAAAYVEPPQRGRPLPATRITFPDGTVGTTDERGIHERLSQALGRRTRVNRRELGEEGIVETTLANPWTPQLEEYWPEEVEGLAYRGIVTDEVMPEGTFFDLAMVHILTTATLRRLSELYPEGRFEVRRFRPNILVEAEGDGFVENDWIGRTLRIGGARLKITGPCQRCVMTTLPQDDLPKDPGILRAAAKHNEAKVGVYACVLEAGEVRRGDLLRLE